MGGVWEPLETKLGKSGVTLGTRSKRLPEKLPLFSPNWDIIYAGLAAAHQSILIEFPLLIAVRSEPIAGVVVPFILKANGDAIVVECPKLFDQAIVQFLGPLAT